MTDLLPPTESTPESTNAAPYSVSELAGALKRTLETTYDHVRVRAEISKVTRHSSGHVYLTLKDDRAAIDGVIWKGNVSRLKAQPEMGLEVIVTGKITTFPASSKYQIVIESLEAAGMGALLAQLERLKGKLSAEGLFDPSRKKPLPFAPKTIGVITSPTGAVIRDILHRIRDRWPCRVIVWPVVVQGDAAPGQVIRALKGFENGEAPKPDVIIIARGGGSVEDLWPFNDEALARAVAACPIPIISAVGHETDTTLIDFVSDRRAPTPTGAAEMATPVLSELKGFLLDLERRRVGTFGRYMESRRERVALLSRALPKPQDLINSAQQRLDYIAHRLDGGLLKNLNLHETGFVRVAGRFNPALLARPQALKRDQVSQLSTRALAALTRRVALAESHARLPAWAQRMDDAVQRQFKQRSDRLSSLEQLRQSLNPDRPLNLGFARVHRKDGALIASAAAVNANDALELHFKDGIVDVVATTEAPPQTSLPKPAPKKVTPPSSSDQGSLF
ncbi:exodeoxyribonuclease VII large subunit [Asticcacaulis sp. SL142]|uniref:exodeoxyribonuclease VII large subunit n=1 Tax=Asticcacaulis sp. SL142 TaxID=2995155 RepID=UPI00226C8550|nr:exodeoxyribonuclease VII large subunit [Asticcacaulis sp. SL142]WAC48538.1 exodeoxyribonuclease VII large subunit [Asticcacaulis sp. SL142]